MTLLRTKPACPICGRALEELRMMDFFEHDCFAALADRVLTLENEAGKTKAESSNLRGVAASARVLWMTVSRYLSEKGKMDMAQAEKEVRNANALLMKDLQALEDGESYGSI